MGTDHDNSAFAAARCAAGGGCEGSARYPGARRLLICADSGGSNAARARAWKVELARLAAETGLEITCCHYPPGTSRWNKVERRLFAQITPDWRGPPLTRHQAVVELITATTTNHRADRPRQLDTREYPTGLRYTRTRSRPCPSASTLPRRLDYCVRPDPSDASPIPERRPTRQRKLNYFSRADSLGIA